MELPLPRPKGYKVAIPDLRELLEAGWGTGDIARKYGIDYRSVWWRIQKENIPFRPDRSGRHNGAWKGGRRQSGPYVYVYCPEHPFATQTGCVLEHRLAMELKLGRYLLPKEVVHHKKGFRNHPSNLKLFASNADHLAETLRGKVPNWTAAGRRRILEAVHLYWSRHKKPNRDKSKKRGAS